MKFSFIVLHYLQKAVEDTIECIESIIKNVEHDDYNIVVVDNGSKDKSGEILTKKYAGNERIDIQLLEDNLGFAQGNNHGAMTAIKKYSPDFLVIINNDTIIKQRHFLNLIENEYKANKFDVLGPYIFDKYLYPQNPVQMQPVLTVDDVEYRIVHIKRLRDKAISLGDTTNAKSNIKNTLRKNIVTGTIIRETNKIRLKNKYIYNPYREAEDIILHGSALIFAKSYYANRDYIFYPETFLYCEEEILYYICKRDNLTMRYQPKIKIYHKEDASSDARFKSSIEKKMFKYEQGIASYEILKELIIKDKEIVAR